MMPVKEMNFKLIVDKKKLFNGIIDWCIVHVGGHSSEEQRTDVQIQKAIYDHLPLK